MVSKLKNKLQESLVRRQFRLYEKQVAAQDISYDSWIRQKEQEERQNAQTVPAANVKVVSFDGCTENFDLKGFAADDIVVFTEKGGVISPAELAWIGSYFEKNTDCVIAYADEDVCTIRQGEVCDRKEPWLKPDWSPDTLISYFYFGGIFAVRAGACKQIAWRKEADYRRNLYDFVLKAVEVNGRAEHIDSVLFHRESIMPWGYEETYSDLKKEAYIRRGWPLKPEGKVSIIIPSKDHPGVLSNCIHSVMEASTYRDFEIIVVDNGSNPHNKARIEMMRDMLHEEHHFKYHYEPMPFNFSRMCNIGASLATGDYLLFLNDDIEITQEKWLEKMMELAVLPHVGAVGVKLIYPTTEIMQHAGITNIHLGPAHKLQFRSDANEYYYKRNRLPVDVLGVTGACLLLKRDLFDKLGGWPEDLAVAFNDVELCYHIHDLGYVNVVRNDVTLVHHESLSRGADDSVAKLKRLHSELDHLYELHPHLYNNDPYYHRYLVKDVLDAEFYPASRYDYTRRVEKVEPKLFEGGLQPVWHNEVLRIGIEFARDMQKWTTGTEGSGNWFIQGWTYALWVDNCRYQFGLLLKPVNGEDLILGKDGQPGAAPVDADLHGPVYHFPCTRQYRPDIEANLHTIIHPKLPGFCVEFDRNALPEGEYLIGVLWEDTCSRQKLYRFSAETLTIRK
ncbi:MAG: glycosyltransferase [Lachnospiraceae bacterium]|nr:glycosyltransferase [Lachnospiraceae bacterium]